MINDGSAPGNVDTLKNKMPTAVDNDKEGFGDFEFQNESLLSLVQPELLSLSQHWLAALRDHALLSLPPGELIHYTHHVLLFMTINLLH